MSEVQSLAVQGIQELILIAQDTTLYGIDIYGKKVLPQLIEEISKVEGIKWIRLLYCYPEEITDELIEVMARNPKVCKYIDMPIQHISNKILRLMGRKGTKENISNVIHKLKANIKDIALRTTFIVGFPGETEEDFKELLSFVESTKFNHVGVFQYSAEEGTAAARMKDVIAEDIKQKREKELMLAQQEISYNNNKNRLNSVIEVLIEGFNGEYFIGRTEHMAPDIDGVVFVRDNEDCKIGDFVFVKIDEISEYDLLGDVYYESCK
jgi:SSU ribosomal protein S12P methylthiotransferase (EC 2.-.-.-)